MPTNWRSVFCLFLNYHVHLNTDSFPDLLTSCFGVSFEQKPSPRRFLLLGREAVKVPVPKPGKAIHVDDFVLQSSRPWAVLRSRRGWCSSLATWSEAPAAFTLTLRRSTGKWKDPGSVLRFGSHSSSKIAVYLPRDFACTINDTLK